MASRLRIILVFAAVMGFIALVALYRSLTAPDVSTQVEADRAALVRTAPLQRRHHPVIETFYGLIEPHAEVELAFQITGRLADLHGLDEGDRVRKGQTLAALEPKRFEASLYQAEARGEQAKADLAAAQARVTDAEARVADAELELKRLEQLQAGDAAKQREVDKARLAVSIAKAALESARSGLSAASANYDATRAAVDLARINLEDATLLSPIDGYVAHLPAEVGEMVNPGQLVFRLVDLHAVKLVVGVVERKLPTLKVGQKVDVDVRALASLGGLEAERTGEVAVIPPAADGMTGLFNVEIRIANDDELLKPGMIGKAIVHVKTIEAVVIPADAVSPTDAGPTAYFLAGGKAERHFLEPLLVDKDAYLVADAPAGVEALIVEGQNRLRDGQTVKVVDAHQ